MNIKGLFNSSSRKTELQEKEVLVMDVQQTIEEIHKEFLTASDNILKEANEILAQKLRTKANRLVSLGFINSTEVQESKGLVRKRQVADLIEMFMISNPFNKIITQEKVFEICKKYNLIYSNAHRYKGFVPEKNLKDIENFKYPESAFYNVMSSQYMGVPGTYNRFVERFKTKESALEFIANSQEKFLEIENPAKSLMICAPEKDMIIYNREEVKNNQIVQIPDPIVLFPLPFDCFMIVTAWGDESKDPDVVNEKMN